MRPWEKEGLDMRKAWSHRESETELKWRNQELQCGGERGGNGEWEMMDDIRDSRQKDSEGRIIEISKNAISTKNTIDWYFNRDTGS